MNMAHEKRVEADSQYKCKTCQQEFSNKNELNSHIIENHRSYKPCRHFATNTCEYNEECKYPHVVLQKGQQLCFKCGNEFTKKSVLLNHIKNYHNDPCLKYLEGKCTYGDRCVYKHRDTIVQDVERSFANSPAETPNIYSHQDFPQVPPTEKRLVGTKNQQLIDNMSKIVNQMSQMMTLITKMIVEESH